jgi:hypothetical protein
MQGTGKRNLTRTRKCNQKKLETNIGCAPMIARSESKKETLKAEWSTVVLTALGSWEKPVP